MQETKLSAKNRAVRAPVRVGRIVLFAAVFALVAFCIDVAVSRRRPLLAGVPFSASYSDCNGELLHVYLAPDETFRVYKSITEYPPEFLEALLLQEDRKFYVHHGINPLSLVRAGVETYVRHSRRIGASTITMQTAKLRYHLHTKSVCGKLLQIFLALRMELLYSKQQILDAYINLAPCGKNIEGFEAASRYFFGKSISDTVLSEKLMLCVLPQNPTKRCPSLSAVPEELLVARMRLFEKWCALHPEDATLSAFMRLPPSLVCAFPREAPHFTRILALGSSSLQTAAFPPSAAQSVRGAPPCGVQRTSLDMQLQRLLEARIGQFVQEHAREGITNASALLVDCTTMQVRAEVGSADFFNERISGQIDGNLSKRSPGSALKPFVYALALEQGLIHYSSMLKDAPANFSEYTPENYGGSFRGPLKAWQALTESRNIPAIDLASRLHGRDLYDFLQGACISLPKQKDDYGLSLVLGSAEVSPFELTKLYCALVNDGMERDFVLSSAATAARAEGWRILSPEASFIVRQMLYQNPAPESPSAASDRRGPIGYKTGTSIGFRDAWTCGFFGQYVLCIWVGNFDGTGNAAFLGRYAAAPLFFAIADSLIAGGFVSERPETPPAAVALVDVCAVSGALPNKDCPQTEKTWFIPGVSPIARCRIHRRISVDTRTGYRTDDETAPWSQSVVREFWPSDLALLFAEAGLPRLLAPQYPPQENAYSDVSAAFPPKILSPLDNTEYMLRRSDKARRTLILEASADASVSELFWFANSSFICRSKPGEKIEWNYSAGTYELTVIDDRARSDSRHIVVREVE